MDRFAWRLGRVLHLPVIDRTNLKGAYDYDFAFIEEVPPDIAERRGIELHPSLFDVLRKELAIRLEFQKGLVEVIVVDTAKRPADN